MHEKIYVLLLVYNGWRDTIECLESLLKSNYENYQIVVVDNNSPNNSLDRILSWAKGDEIADTHNPSLSKLSTPKITKPLDYVLYDKSQAIVGGVAGEVTTTKHPLIFIQSGENKGFAAGNNIGLQYILSKNDAQHVWLLNNDTVVEHDTLANLKDSADQYIKNGDKIGIIGSKLMYYNSPNTIQSVGGTFNKWFATTKHVGAFEVDRGQYDNNKVINNIEYAIGASMFVPIQFIRDVGLLCEDYFLYFEELDWTIRGKTRGWGLGYCWKAKVFHKEGGSIGSSSHAKQKSELADYYGSKNRIVFTKKFYKSNVWSVKLGFVFVALNRIKRGQFSRLWLIARAMSKS